MYSIFSGMFWHIVAKLYMYGQNWTIFGQYEIRKDIFVFVSFLSQVHKRLIRNIINIEVWYNFNLFR